MPKKSEKRKPETIDPISEKSCGNVFADLGLPNPELRLAKAQLVVAIRMSIEARNLTQKQAAELLGIDQPKISALLRGRTQGYTMDRLINLLARLGNRVEMHIRSI